MPSADKPWAAFFVIMMKMDAAACMEKLEKKLA